MSRVSVEYTPTAKVVDAYIAEGKRREAIAIKEQKEEEAAKNAEQKEYERINKIGEDMNKADNNYYKLKELVQKTLLDEAINKIYKPAIPIEQDIIKKDNVTFVEAYTESNGVVRTLNEMRRATPFLSSIALLIEETEEEMMKDVVKGDPSTYNIDPEELVKFNKALEDEEVRDMSDIVKDRVQDTVDEFIDDNRRDKAKQKEIIEKSMEKADKAPSEEIADEIVNEAKREIYKIQEARPYSIFEAMIRKVSESSYTNGELSTDLLTEDGNLDMNSVMENTIIMYTFLETMNTAKIAKVDENYIKDLYMNL